MVVAYEKRPGRCDVFGGIGQLASLRRVQNEKTHALIYFVVIAPSGRDRVTSRTLKKRLKTQGFKLGLKYAILYTLTTILIRLSFYRILLSVVWQLASSSAWEPS